MRLSSLRGAIVPVFLLALWEILSRAGVFSAVVLPPPSAVAVKWVSGLLPALPYEPGTESHVAWMFSGEMPRDAVASLSRVISGFLIGAGLAVPIGLLLGTSDRLHGLFGPLLEFLRPIPPIAYIPLAIVWFGLGNPPALFLIALGTFFPVLVNTIAGVRQVDSIYIRAARNLGAGSWTMFRRVILPAASPFVLAGMRIGIGTAFIVVIVAEMIAVSDGLGYRILEAREYMWSDKIIGGMVTIGLLGLIIDGAMSRLNDHLLRWHRGLER
ncbi:ABC transporter permease [uncultured Methylobacterium sp.]|uniref:ABC transporter permease n=1 Tax=uncultured Methylobacterium sp. TaxID=157278 RepID=UPI0035CBE8E6